MLARFLARGRDELRADFRQYYGLDLERIREEMSCSSAASLAAMLPRQARSWVRENPDLAWDDRTWMLRSIEHSCRVLCWMRTKDAARGLNPPRPIDPPSVARDRANRIARTDVAEIDRVLGRG